MLGISDIRKQLFTSRPELERATNSSYHDMTREIVLPRNELESVLSCVYTDIPAELTLSEKASKKSTHRFVLIFTCFVRIDSSVLYNSSQ